eukprot:scaffold37046_cov72-Phaeocystis_antarctica.AAC.3
MPTQRRASSTLPESVIPRSWVFPYPQLCLLTYLLATHLTEQRRPERMGGAACVTPGRGAAGAQVRPARLEARRLVVSSGPAPPKPAAAAPPLRPSSLGRCRAAAAPPRQPHAARRARPALRYAPLAAATHRHRQRPQWRRRRERWRAAAPAAGASGSASRRPPATLTRRSSRQA